MRKDYPKLVLNRNFVLASTKGHVVAFVKGEPISVPPAVYKEAIGIGALPVEGDVEGLFDEPRKNDKSPSDPADRAPLIYAAILKLTEINDRKDFTAAGSPAVKAISREVGFDVDGREVAVQWQKYHDEKANSSED